MSAAVCTSSRPDLISVFGVCVFALTVLPFCIRANQFKEAMWLTPQESSIDLQCKADLIKQYQPLVTTSWAKDDSPVIPSERLEMDNLGTLRITQPTPEDHGMYACLVTYWDTAVTTNEIRLHTGPPGRTLGESSLWIAQNNDIVGVSNVWAISIILSTVMGIIWLLTVAVLRIKRSRCCGKDYELLASGDPGAN